MKNLLFGGEILVENKPDFETVEREDGKVDVWELDSNGGRVAQCLGGANSDNVQINEV